MDHLALTFRSKGPRLALLWLIAALPSLSLTGPAASEEPPADLRILRSHREGLAAGSVREAREVLKAMLAAPHSRFGALLYEALLRAQRRIEAHRERIPELQAERAEQVRLRAEAEQSSSTSMVLRAEAKVAEIDQGVTQLSAELLVDQQMLRLLEGSVGHLAETMSPAPRSKLADELIDKVRTVHHLPERILMLRLIGQISSPNATLALMNVVRNRSEKAEARTLALESLGNLGQRASLPAVVGALSDKDWRVQAEAVETVRRLHQRSSIPMMITFLRTAHGRVRGDAAATLRSLTGEKFAADAETWDRWWQDHLATFTMPEKPAPRPVQAEAERGGAHFYGIQTFSRGVIFVLDVSGSMAQPARRYANTKSGTRKIDVARSNLKTALLGLHPESYFNVLLYADDVEPVFDVAQIASDERRREALEIVKRREPVGATNLYAGIHRALTTSGTGNFKKGFKLVVDTVFLLTDGQPTQGMVVRTDLILAEVRSLNEVRRIQIHTVGVGQHDAKFLEALARQNRGLYANR